jgi:Recombinase
MPRMPETVRRIFTEYTAGYSARGIANGLNAHRIASPAQCGIGKSGARQARSLRPSTAIPNAHRPFPLRVARYGSGGTISHTPTRASGLIINALQRSLVTALTDKHLRTLIGQSAKELGLSTRLMPVTESSLPTRPRALIQSSRKTALNLTLIDGAELCRATSAVWRE